MTLTVAVLVPVLGLLVLLGPASSQTLDSSVGTLVLRNTDFASQLYRAQAKRTDDNVFLSPLALSTALAALLTATGGQTREQLQRGLALSVLDPETLPDLFQSLRAAGGGSNLTQGVAILPSQAYQVPQTYRDLVSTKFGASVEGLTFTDPPEAVRGLNRWAQTQTGDKVREVVSSLESGSQLLLATVASYQARFTQRFNASNTQEERFFVSNYQVVVVPMMLETNKYFLAYDRSLKTGVLKLPMTDGAAMLVVLPDEGVDIADVEDKVNGEKIRAWIKQLRKTWLQVQLPRFQLDSSYMLRDTLQNLEITKVFESGAEINDLGVGGAKLDQVYQKLLLNVDETSDGITGDTTGFNSLPPRLTINRPFIFLIYQEATGSVLFMGRVVNPTRV